MLFGVIVIIVLQDMLDVIGMVKEVAGQRTAGKTDDIPKVTCSARIESEEVRWRTKQERGEERKRIHSWARGHLMRVRLSCRFLS
jgi:hypothetical protein